MKLKINLPIYPLPRLYIFFSFSLSLTCYNEVRINKSLHLSGTVKVMDGGIVLREFEIQSRYYLHF